MSVILQDFFFPTNIILIVITSMFPYVECVLLINPLYCKSFLYCVLFIMSILPCTCWDSGRPLSLIKKKPSVDLFVFNGKYQRVGFPVPIFFSVSRFVYPMKTHTFCAYFESLMGRGVCIINNFSMCVS